MRILKYSLFLIITVVALAATPTDQTMTKEKDGTFIVNTTDICAETVGYRGNTPLLVYIKGGKVVKIEYLTNQETPQYFAKLKGAFKDSWNGKSVKEAKKTEPDGYTGATYSAKAVSENVRAALDYYSKHK